MGNTNKIKDPLVNFKIYSKNSDISLITLAIKQVDYSNKKNCNSKTNKISSNRNDIIIIEVNDFSDDLIDSYLKLVNDDIKNLIVITSSKDVVLISSLSRLGLTNIFVLPLELQKFKNYLSQLVDNLSVKLHAEEVQKQKIDLSDFNNIIGKSNAIIKTLYQAKNVAKNYKVDLLLLGETGTGKSLLARSIHNNSPIVDSPFVSINCSAIPDNLLESELFGYEQGAFTDAKSRKLGLFELAKNGTIFLDEIGDMSLHLQAKLLSVLDSRKVRRLGGIKDIPIKARIISATNRDLLSLVEQNLFRRDLYHRLSVVTIKIPQLRERGRDILLLANHFIREAANKFDKNILTMSSSMKKFLLKYPWPGNIRELRNAIERAVLLSEGSKINTGDLFNLSEGTSVEQILEGNKVFNLEFNEDGISLDEINKIIIHQVLRKFKDNKTKTAKYLRISRPRLDRILKS